MSEGFSYFPLYQEWWEDVLGLCKHLLDATQLYNDVFASLLTYIMMSDIAQNQQVERSNFGGLRAVAEVLQYEYKIRKGGRSEPTKHPPMVKLVSQR